MPTYETLDWSLSDGVATITLNRPRAGNALTMQMGQELMDASIRCDDNPEVRAVVLTGAGKMFCVGADLKQFPPAGPKMAAEIKLLTTWLHAAISRFVRMDAPLICAINGTAAGAGMSLALIGDMALVAESARFKMAYSRLALTPDCAATYYLPRLVGFRRAFELYVTNRVLSATEAEAWGLVNQVVPNDALLSEAQALAVQLASGPMQAIGATKRLFHSAWTESLESQMAQETRTITNAARSPEAAEGFEAFFEKREPNFNR
ncbi:MAG: enoyl-CoA hydratase-related protein [Candidatus Poribacteria bacterium]|nr:enoyl-CoA hydratase-related protein [Candidatus Poribacteria bacterium]